MEKGESLTGLWDLFRKIIWPVYIAVSFVIWILIPYFLNWGIVDAFYSGEGDMAYIYKVLGLLWSESRLIGSAMTKQQIISILPEYNSTCIFTYIAAGCGKLVSIFFSVLLVAVIIVSISKCKKSSSAAGHVIACILVQFLMLVLVLLLQNWQVMPFVSIYSNFNY